MCVFTEPEDYEALSSELTFDSDQDRACVSIRLEDDDALENTEELQVSLTTEEEPVILNPDMAVVSILDIDGERVIVS